MVHRFYTTPETARELTTLKKKNGFYFRTLTRTDNIDRVYCEVTDPGYQFIKENGMTIEELNYVIRDREAGNEIERFATREEAEQQFAKYEEQDLADGTYEENFYEIKCPEDVAQSFSIEDLNVWTNKGQACEVSVEIKDVTAVFVMWDWYDYDEEKRHFALQQLCTILNLGGTFAEIERHMRMNGIDCELKELQHD